MNQLVALHGRAGAFATAAGAALHRMQHTHIWYLSSMCGRFTQSYTWRELVELYRLTQPARNLRPRYNIAPTTTIDVVRSADNLPELPSGLGIL
ncbi:MAG: SOS response-associated peptidase family protein [Methylocella sp.]